VTTAAIPRTIEVSFSAILTLSQECWRLKRVAVMLKGRSEGLACSRASQRISALLAAHGVCVEDYSGRPYDPGMALEVLDIIEDASMDSRLPVIEETVSPSVNWNGNVAQQGQIIVRQAPTTNEPISRK
jgi:hypothetical protein